MRRPLDDDVLATTTKRVPRTSVSRHGQRERIIAEF